MLAKVQVAHRTCHGENLLTASRLCNPRLEGYVSHLAPLVSTSLSVLRTSSLSSFRSIVHHGKPQIDAVPDHTGRHIGKFYLWTLFEYYRFHCDTALFQAILRLRHQEQLRRYNGSHKWSVSDWRPIWGAIFMLCCRSLWTPCGPEYRISFCRGLRRPPSWQCPDCDVSDREVLDWSWNW